MVQQLRLKLAHVNAIRWKQYRHIALVDTQPHFGNHSLPAGVRPMLVFDHYHANATTPARFEDIRPDYGATATILWEYLTAADLEMTADLATAVAYAIRTETQELGRDISAQDVEAYLKAYPKVSTSKLAKILNPMTKRKIFKKLCTPERGISPNVLESVLELGVELAREGREGRKIGTLFTVGDEENVLRYSRPLILDPLYGHPSALKRIELPEMRESVKELAQLDGAFIVSGEGVVLSAARYLEAPVAGVQLPLGLGTRHIAAAAVSLHTQAIAVVLSASSVVRVFANGEIVGEILPELWLIGRDSLYIKKPHIEESEDEKITVATKEG